MVRIMTIYPAKIMAGSLAGFLSLFVENLLPLFITVTVFELVDFITGVIKSALPISVRMTNTEYYG